MAAFPSTSPAAAPQADSASFRCGKKLTEFFGWDNSQVPHKMEPAGIASSEQWLGDEPWTSIFPDKDDGIYFD